MPKNPSPKTARQKAAQPLPPIAEPILAWYRQNRRVLPFREDPQPYHVWVSEIMLQQTRMTAVLPYYQRFIKALPGVDALAACPPETLHKLWEGLGYYSRARNLQQAARILCKEHGGRLPANYAALLALPGIGPYTAGAIASIAFGLPVTAVDGNVLRVFSRLLDFRQSIDAPAAKKLLAQEVERQLPLHCPGDFNQALMELGALVCLPGAPQCGLCPLAALCRGRAAGIAARLPLRAEKKSRPQIPVCLLVCRAAGGRVLLQKRPNAGLLAGLWQPPLLEGCAGRAQAQAQALALLPGLVFLAELPAARHVFTHKVWNMQAWLCSLPPRFSPPEQQGPWALVTAEQLRTAYALPGAFKSYLPWLLQEK